MTGFNLTFLALLVSFHTFALSHFSKFNYYNPQLLLLLLVTTKSELQYLEKRKTHNFLEEEKTHIFVILWQYLGNEKSYERSAGVKTTGFSVPFQIHKTNFRKHRQNCECCPVSLLIVRSQRLSWIQVLNCQHCNQCQGHKSLGVSLSLSLSKIERIVKTVTKIKNC